MLHLSSYNSATQTFFKVFHKTLKMFLQCFIHSFEHVPHALHLIDESIAQMHYIPQYRYSYLLAFS